MGSRDYDNFDVLIEAMDPDRFRVRVTQCAVGDTPASISSLPFSDVELENVLLKLDPGRSGTRRILDPYAQASVDLGAGLFDAVFRDDVLVAWSRSVDVARDRQHGLRLRLRFAEAPSLAGLPWEFLYDRRGNRFFAQSDRTPIVRYLDVANPPRPLVVGGPLRILVVISSPHDLAPLQVEKEWAEIHDALAEKERAGLVVVDQLPHATLGELQRWLRRRDVHVLHFVGHGDFDQRASDGVLAFCDANGRATRVTSAQLGAHVRDHDPLRLVVLNACQTATTDNTDAYSGMAQGLIQQEAAAVVAMQFPITDGAAIVFTTEFYGALADGEPVDQAVTSARKAMLADFGREWATPVLFLRAPDGRIFDRIESRPPATVVEPDVSRASPPLGETAVHPVGRPPPIDTGPLPPVPPEPVWSETVVAPPPEDGAGPDRGTTPGWRRRWIAIVVAAFVLIAGGLVAKLISQSGSNHSPGSHAITSTSGRSTSTTSGITSRTGSTTSKPALPGFRLVGSSGPVSAFSGPSSHAYRLTEQVPVGTIVYPTCDLYGEAPIQDALWYWTDRGWISDDYVETGRSTPVRNACSGNVNSPTAGSQPPSSTLGPFGALGHGSIPIRDAPGNSANPVGSLAADSMVSLICHVSSSWVEAPQGGTSSADWDKIAPDQWIPDADLLTGHSGSPAPACQPAPAPPANPWVPPTNASPTPSPNSASAPTSELTPTSALTPNVSNSSPGG